MGTVLALALVAAIQVVAAGDLSGPFLDTRLHVDYDNALFSVLARNGLRNGDARSQWGVTVNDYAAWGERAGPPRYYTDHPFLLKAAFQQFARVAGSGESSSRAFYLLVSFGVAAGVFALLRLTTGSLAAALAGAVTLVSLPVFSKFQTCVKFELDGMLLAVWLLTALAWHQARPNPRRLAVLAALVAACVLVHWTALLAAGFVGLALLADAWRCRDRARGRVFLVCAAGGVVGLALLGALMVWLQGSWAGVRGVLAAAAARRTATGSIPWPAWSSRQATYAAENFGVPFLVAGAIAAVGLLVLWWRGRGSAAADGRPSSPLTIAVVATLASALTWVFAFRQGSFVHSFWQLPLALPAALLVGAAVAAVRGHRRLATVALLVVAALAVQLNLAGASARREARAARLGTDADVAFLASLRDQRFARLAFVPVARHPLDDWFQGPLFQYYTDRPVVVVQPGMALTPTDKVLTLRYQDRERVIADLGLRLGVRLVDERCGARLCAYDVAVP